MFRVFRKKRIGILGGTFNPIHTGHIKLAGSFAKRLRLDRVLIIPTNIPPHKENTAAPAEHRMNMCLLAAKAAGGIFEASDIEIKREGKSYTCDTLEQLHQIYPDAKFYLIVGADMFMTFETWNRFERLRKLAVVCTIKRGEIGERELRAHARRLRRLGCKCRIADVEPMDISSTMIREALGRGESINGLVAPQVEEYIADHELYR